MANYETLKAAIAAAIKQNGNNEITGALLQQQLLSMVNSLGANYQFAGIATPSTNPGTPDQNVFYFAIVPGTYSNFNAITISGFSVLKYNGTWTKEEILDFDITTQFQTLGLMLSKYSIQTTFWNNANYKHIVVPVNGGETIEYAQTQTVFYCAFLTSYETPIENETPNFVTGYSGRQTYTTGSFVVPDGTRFLIVNNPQISGLSKLKIDGVDVIGGVFGAIIGLSQRINKLPERYLEIADLGIVPTTDNIANPANIFQGLIDVNGVKNGGINPPEAGAWNMIKIPVRPGQILSFGNFSLGRGGYAAFFNNDTYISHFTFAISTGAFNGNNLGVVVPAGANILWIDISSPQSPANPYAELMVNYGETLLPYVQYKEKIKTINGVEVIGSDGDSENLATLIADLPVSDGSDISSGYAYIETTTRNVKVKE